MDAVQVEKAVKELGDKPTLKNFVEHFGVFVQGPGGILVIRNLILKLAIRGLIFDTKKVEVKNKELNEYYDIYQLPETWKIDTILNAVKEDKYSIKRGPFGSTIKKSYFVSEGYKVYEQQNAIYNDFNRGSYYLNEKKFKELKAFEVKPKDLIISCSGTVGKVAEAPEDMEQGVINQALLKLSLNQDKLLNDYFKIVFQAYFLDTPELRNLKGTAQKNMVPVKTLKSLPYPLPPLEEQKRIVAKVDELMALCDQLETMQQQQANTLLKANTAAIHALLSSDNSKEDLTKNWQRIADNFHTLYGNTLPMPPGGGRQKKYFVGLENLKQLRQMIIQLAMLGKLLPQNSEESVEKLMKEINSEKFIYTRKNISTIDDALSLPAIPRNWEWVTLDQISQDIHYGYTASANHEITEVRLLRITDIQNDKVDWMSVPGCEVNGKKLSRNKLHEGDLLIARTGGTIGKTYLVNNLTVNSVFASYLIRFKPLKSIWPEYIKLYTLSKIYWDQLVDNTSGSAQPNVNATSLKSMVIPFPPMEEQKRIVAKVDQLMVFCNQLEQQLTTAYGDAEKLIDATIKKLVA